MRAREMLLERLPEKIRLLDVDINGAPSGQLVQQSGFEYRYLNDDEAQPAVGLLMLPNRLTWKDGDLFPVMDQYIKDTHLVDSPQSSF